MVVLLLLAAACGPAATGIDPTPIDPSLLPEQTSIEKPTAFHLNKGGYDWTVTPRAAYIVSGVVLSRENYSYGWNADLSPCDVALAWGALCKDRLYKKVRWSQSGRWYWWEIKDDFGRDNAFIVRHSSNNHIVPATRNLARAARSLRRGDLAELSGVLVDLDGRKGELEAHWHTSLSRSDEGDGSCEVLYLTRLKTKGKVYE
jgi:hypothetical protein